MFARPFARRLLVLMSALAITSCSPSSSASGGGIVTYRAGGRQLIGVASGMKSPVWPGGADQSRIMIYGLR